MTMSQELRCSLQTNSFWFLQRGDKTSINERKRRENKLKKNREKGRERKGEGKRVRERHY